MSAWHKLVALWRRGGARAVVLALGKRFIYKRWRSLVYEHVAPVGSPAVPWPDGYRYIWLGPAAEMSPGDLDDLRRFGAGLLLEDMAPTDGVYVVRAGMEIASYGVVMVRSPQHSVLGLPEDARLIGLCETLPAHRRRGLFRWALVQTVQTLRSQDAAPIFIEVDEANLPSRSGIVGAGFEFRGPLDARIWFGRWVRRADHWSRLRRGA